jgi:hypothetical protein
LKADHTIIAAWHAGLWAGAGEDPKWTTVGAGLCAHPIEQSIFLGYWGEVFCVGSGDSHEERIHPNDLDYPEKRGPMNGIRGIGGKAYAVGIRRQAYRRDGANLWTCIDHSARPDPKDDRMTSFEAIDGFTEQDIYTAGRIGEIWRYDGTLWKQIESPTDLTLTNLCCAGDGEVYICGLAGMLIKGRGSRWQVIEHASTDEDFWGISWFNDKLYLSTMRAVFRLEGDRLKQVDFGKDAPRTCFHLSAADGVMWSIGAKDVMAFDGKSWTRID